MYLSRCGWKFGIGGLSRRRDDGRIPFTGRPRLDQHGIRFRRSRVEFGCEMRSESLRIYFCEFSAEKKQLRRIVDPDQDDYKRAGGSVRGTEAGFSQVESNEMLAHSKQQCRDGGPDDYIAPFQAHGGYEFIDRPQQTADLQEQDYSPRSLKPRPPSRTEQPH